MLNCQELKKIIHSFRKRYSFLEGELLNFKETGKMSEETRKELEKLKKEFDEFEEREIGERVKKLEEEWEEWEGWERVKIPETPHFLLEKVLNKFIEGFKKNEEYNDYILGSLISDFINQNIDLYIIKEKKKGKEIDEIKEVVIRLNVEDLKYPLSYLGSSNREKCHLIIQGNCGDFIGEGMSGGKLEVKGNCGVSTGAGMSGGELEVKGNCRNLTALEMSGGKLVILGEVEEFGYSAFSPKNKGEIWHKGKKIWPK